MVRWFGILVATAVLGLTGFGSEPMAQGVGLQHPASGYYRSGTRQRSVRGPQVRGFAQRRVGGYSYFRSDTINTYGDSRSKYARCKFRRRLEIAGLRAVYSPALKSSLSAKIESVRLESNSAVVSTSSSSGTFSSES